MIVVHKSYPSYRPSGVEWLRKVPAHWAMERAKWLFQKMERPVREHDEVVTCFRDGVVTLRKNRRELGFTESLKEIGYQGIRHGDLVIHSMDAFAGAIGVADSDGKGTPVYSVCKPEPQVNAYFYAYILREMARNQWIQALAKGIRERSSDFRYTEFALQPVPLPPLSEQTAIVRYLDHADERIRRYVSGKQKLIRLLEEEKQAVIHRTVTRGLDPNVRLKPSGVEWLGDIPAHWEVRRFKTLGKGFTNGTTAEQLQKGISDFSVSRIETISTGQIDYSKVGYLNESSVIKSSYLKPDDFLVSHINSYERVGNSARYKGERTLIHGMNLIRVIPLKCIVPDYLEYLLKSSLFTGSMKRACKPAINQVSVTTMAIKAIQFPLPPLPEQTTIVAYLDKATANIDTAIDRARRQIELLQEYRTRLIADVVTGQVDVRAGGGQVP